MSDRTGQPTEEPTQRRWEKSFEDGQLAFSTELMGGLIVLVAIIFFMASGQWFFDAILNSLRESFTFFDPAIDRPDSIMLSIHRNVVNVGVVCIGLMVPLVVVSMIAGALQTRFNLSTKPLAFKWSKISPKSGVKRLFSTRSLNRGAISILKSVVVVVAAYVITVNHMAEISESGLKTYGNMINVGAQIVLEIGLVTGVLMVVVGCADLGFQIWKQRQDLLMTKQEVREEQKDTDGDPQIKARIKETKA